MPHVLIASDDIVHASSLAELRTTWEVEAICNERDAAEKIDDTADLVIFDTSSRWVDNSLIEVVSRTSPDAVRVALVPEQEVWAAVKTSKLTHQVLSVRSGAGIVADVCDRAFHVRSLIDDPDLREVIAAAGDVSATPELWADLNAALEDPNSGVGDIAQVIERDAAISAQVLRLVNSAFFGLSRQIVRLQDAVSLLGLGTIRAMVLEADASRRFGTAFPGFKRQELQAHGLAAANVARRIAGKSNAADAFLASLTMDIGLNVLASVRPDQTKSAIDEARGRGVALRVVELERNGYSHAEVGACLLGLWGLPMTVVEAVAHHHDKPDFNRLMSVRELVFIARHAAQSTGHADPYGETGALVSDTELSAHDPMVSIVFDNAYAVAAEHDTN